jgi:hypothetical protein
MRSLPSKLPVSETFELFSYRRLILRYHVALLPHLGLGGEENAQTKWLPIKRVQ